MIVERLELENFRCYDHAEIDFPSGATLIKGDNGQGKTSLLEAISWLSTTHSLRGVPDETLIQSGHDEAIIRTRITNIEGRDETLNAQIKRVGRNRVEINNKGVTRAKDLLGHLRVTIFSPDDLEFLKGSAGIRRRYLDDLAAAISTKTAAAQSDYEKVLRQRNSLLKTRLFGPDARSTLEVFDEQLVAFGAQVTRQRLKLSSQLVPLIAKYYGELAGTDPGTDVIYESVWLNNNDDIEGSMSAAIAEAHQQEMDRGVTLVGPHRDDWHITLSGNPARFCASQGEQRCLALAMRLGGHTVVADSTGDDPVLLLDDVFSELDPHRSRALVNALPAGQTLLTTAGLVPDGIQPAKSVSVVRGTIVVL